MWGICHSQPSSTSGFCENYIAIRARTLDLGSRKRCFGTWEEARHGSPLFTHNQMSQWKEKWRLFEEHLNKVILVHKKYCDTKWHIFLLAYWISTLETTGMTPTSKVFGRELQVACNLLFGTLPHKEQSATKCVAELLDQLRWPVTEWRPNMTSWPIVWVCRKVTEFCCTAQLRPEENHLSCSRLGKAYTRWSPRPITVCEIQLHPRVKMIVVHLDRLAPYTFGIMQDEQP
jgi:hypothetical protein